jgi:hypothetical protein
MDLITDKELAQGVVPFMWYLGPDVHDFTYGWQVVREIRDPDDLVDYAIGDRVVLELVSDRVKLKQRKGCVVVLIEFGQGFLAGVDVLYVCVEALDVVALFEVE